MGHKSQHITEMILTIILTIFCLFHLSLATQYECNNTETCYLSSKQTNYSVNDELYCSSSIINCNIHCISHHGCQSIIIHSSAKDTNIICNETSSCINTTIYINNTQIYSSSTSNIYCTGRHSCSSTSLYFNGNNHDTLSLISSNNYSFSNSYFECNTISNNTNNTACQLNCNNNYKNECKHSILNCAGVDTTESLCRCNGDGCNQQNMTILYNNPTTTNHILLLSTVNKLQTTIISTDINTDISPDPDPEPNPDADADSESFLESDTFKFIIVIIVIIVFVSGCLLLLCCWKFEILYEYFEKKKSSSSIIPNPNKLGMSRHSVPSRSIHAGNVNKKRKDNDNDYDYDDVDVFDNIEQQNGTGTGTGAEIDVFDNKDVDDHDKQSHSQSMNDDDDIDNNQNRMIPNHQYRNTNSSIVVNDIINRERLPSSYHKYKEEQQKNNILSAPNDDMDVMSQISQLSHDHNKNKQIERLMNKRIVNDNKVDRNIMPNNKNKKPIKSVYISKKNIKKKKIKAKHVQKPNVKRKRKPVKSVLNQAKDDKLDASYQKVDKNQLGNYSKYRLSNTQKDDDDDDESSSDDDTESSSSSSSTESDTDSDTNTSSDDDSSLHNDNSLNKINDIDGGHTKDTSAVDDMLVNMVMLMQQHTPISSSFRQANPLKQQDIDEDDLNESQFKKEMV